MNNDTVSVNFRDPVALLQYEARKKPEIANLVSNAHNLTDADIQAAKILPWMKHALVSLRTRKTEQENAASLMAFLADKIIDGKYPDPMGEVRRWNDQETYIKMGTSQIEIKYNQLVWLDGKGGMWLDTVYSKMIDPRINQYTQFVANASRGDYLGMERQRRNGTLDTPASTIVYGQKEETGMPTRTLNTNSSQMFQIYRV